MAADRQTRTTDDHNRVTPPPPGGGEHAMLQRSQSTKKNEVLSTSLSAASHRYLRQHRNSWPTIEAAATAAAKAIKPKAQQLMTTTEEMLSVDEDSDDEDCESVPDEQDVGRRRPSATRQRRLVARCETHTDRAGSHTYAVAKVWYRRWEEHVGAVRGFVAGSAPAPGPVDMDTQNDDSNTFVTEGVWKLIVAWYGVASTHHLDRKHLFFKDEKVFDVCVLSPYSGIVEHRCKRFNRFEEVGYVELQLRRMFGVSPASRRSRLWISEKTAVPRFRQLLARSRMLNDCVHRDKAYILALELADVAAGPAAAAWPTGEPGDSRGELARYDDLAGDRLDDWNEAVSHGLADLERKVAEQVSLAVSQFSEMAGSTLADAARLLDERQRDVEDQLKVLDARAAAVSSAEKEVAERESALTEERSRLDVERQELDQAKTRFRDEAARVDELNRTSGGGDSKVRLDVGGSIYTTSTQTLRRHPNSLLALMFSGRHELRPEPDGSYFIDRDGAHFRYVLNFLRDGSLDPQTLPTDRSAVRQIICEARYYQLDALVDHLDQLLQTDSAQ